MYMYNKITMCNKFSQTSKSVDSSLSLVAEQIIYYNVLFDAWVALPTLEISIFNYKLWSLPSQPVGLIELLTQN